jgi:hypothetical protein
MVNDGECGAVGGMLGKITYVLGEYLLQCRFIHHKSLAGTRASAVGWWQLIAWATERPSRIC